MVFGTLTRHKEPITPPFIDGIDKKNDPRSIYYLAPERLNPHNGWLCGYCSSENPNGKYQCHHCGAPKKGHEINCYIKEIKEKTNNIMANKAVFDTERQLEKLLMRSKIGDAEAKATLDALREKILIQLKSDWRANQRIVMRTS